MASHSRPEAAFLACASAKKEYLAVSGTAAQTLTFCRSGGAKEHCKIKTAHCRKDRNQESMRFSL